MLTGTGTAGAYHAGVLRALQEAGVKIDVVAGRGMGTVSAMFAAVDGGARLWETGGVWRSAVTRRFYRWRAGLRAAGWLFAAAVATVLCPLVFLAAAAVVYPLAFVLRLIGGAALGVTLSEGYGRLLSTVFGPEALPALLPRIVVALLLALLVLLGVTALRSIGHVGGRAARRGGRCSSCR